MTTCGQAALTLGVGVQRGQRVGSRMHGAGTWDLLQGSRAHSGPSTRPQIPIALLGGCARPPAGSFARGTPASEQQHEQPPWDPMGKAGPQQPLLPSSVLCSLACSGCCPQTLVGGPTERGPVAHGPFPRGCPQWAAAWAPSSAQLLEMQPSPLRGAQPCLPPLSSLSPARSGKKTLGASGQGPALRRHVRQLGLPGSHHQHERNILCQITRRGRLALVT